MKFRKKPVVIEAIQFDGKNSHEVIKWAWEQHHTRLLQKILDLSDSSSFQGLEIPTLEGTMLASAGDWIIRGVKGEFYPCKPDIFEATYEAVSE